MSHASVFEDFIGYVYDNNYATYMIVIERRQKSSNVDMNNFEKGFVLEFVDVLLPMMIQIYCRNRLST